MVMLKGTVALLGIGLALPLAYIISIDHDSTLQIPSMDAEQTSRRGGNHPDHDSGGLRDRNNQPCASIGRGH